MSEKRSSFHMGNEFNGFAEKVYLKAERNEVPPISQENAKIKPDYSRLALKAIGAMPVVLDPKNMDSIMKKMLSCLPVVNQAVIEKNEADGSYQTSVHVAAGGFTANAYPTYNEKYDYGRVRIQKLKYFVVTENTGLSVRKMASTKSKPLVTATIGSNIEVLMEDGQIKIQQKKDYDWIKVEYKGKIGWVPTIYIRPDQLFTEDFKSIRDKPVKLRVEFKNNTVNTKRVKPCKKWAGFGGGGYTGPCPKYKNKWWCVAVGPRILDPKYSDVGKLQNFTGFSKLIKVYLKHKKTKKEKIIQLYVADLKAHSYNSYNFDDKKFTFKSDSVKSANAKVTTSVNKTESKLIPNGIIQTGIRYPKSINNKKQAVVAPKNRDGTIIEFCGAKELTKLGFDPGDYELIKIESNYTKKTRGEKFYQPWVKK